MNPQDPPAPPQPPTPPAPPTPPTPPPDPLPPLPDATPVGMTVTGGTAATPADVYIAFRAQRRELGQQLERLEERRSELSGQLQDPELAEGSRKGIEQRLGEVDQRIAEVDRQIATADADVARAIAVPGATAEPPPPPRTGPPEEVFVLGGIFIVVVLFPMAIAYSRRIWKRSSAAVAAFPQELAERLMRLEQSAEAIAVEVERIGEGQRFMTRLFTESPNARALGARVEEPLDVTRAQDALPVRR
jgi:hypothetical protein